MDNKINDKDTSYIESLNISPQDLIYDYVNVKVLSMGPESRFKLEKLIKEAQDDVENLARILRNF